MSRYADDDDWEQPARYRYRDYDYDHPLPHSGLGIASFVLGLAGLVFLLALFAVGGALELSRPGGLDEESTEATILSFMLFVALVGSLVGLVLGIVGVATGKRKKLFAGIGIGINSLILVGLVGLGVIGALVS